jgi:pyruvate formate lyase activating enzyme
MKNKKFYMNGGITLSGGEPLVHYDFCANIAKKCYENNINLAIDTCGYHKKLSDYDIFVKYNVLFLIDIKHTIEKFHKIITSKSSVLELKLINYLENKKTKY